VHLAIFGAADGQLKLSADTETVALALAVESTGNAALTGSVRVAPFRDGSGRLHPVSIGAPGGSVELPLSIPAGSTATFRIAATLVAEGEYTTDIVLVHGDLRDVAKLVVVRATRDLGVAIEGLEPVRATADVRGFSKAPLNAVLSEKTGRALTLGPPLLLKFARKDANGTRTQGNPRLLVGGTDPTNLPLTPNQSLVPKFEIDRIDGPGEYEGTLRIVAAGSKPVDASFTVTLKESRNVALFAIAVGVLLSFVLRLISEKVRPRLVEVRRTQMLVWELDQLLKASANESSETVVLSGLRRQVASVLLTLEVGQIAGIKDRIDRLTERRKLVANWVYWRRRVAGLEPESLRDKFRPVVDAARDVVLNESATAASIEKATKDLSELEANIAKELRAELTRRIGELRESMKEALAVRPDTELAIESTTLTARLDEAEAQQTGDNLPGALRIYGEVRARWAALLIDDLATFLTTEPPPGVDKQDWDSQLTSLKEGLAAARAMIDRDQEGALRGYERTLLRYVRLVSASLKRMLPQLRTLLERSGNELGALVRDARLEQVKVAEKETAAVLAAIAAGNSQEALSALSRASAAAAEAEARTKVRGENVRTVVRTLMGVTPQKVADDRADEVVVTVEDLAISARRDWAYELIILVVAGAVATLLGVTMLYSPDATWGGWEDWTVAFLWGLGLHGFTFAGISGLRDRLAGAQAAGGSTP